MTEELAREHGLGGRRGAAWRGSPLLGSTEWNLDAAVDEELRAHGVQGSQGLSANLIVVKEETGSGGEKRESGTNLKPQGGSPRAAAPPVK